MKIPSFVVQYRPKMYSRLLLSEKVVPIICKYIREKIKKENECHLSPKDWFIKYLLEELEAEYSSFESSELLQLEETVKKCIGVYGKTWHKNYGLIDGLTLHDIYGLKTFLGKSLGSSAESYKKWKTTKKISSAQDEFLRKFFKKKFNWDLLDTHDVNRLFDGDESTARVEQVLFKEANLKELKDSNKRFERMIPALLGDVASIFKKRMRIAEQNPEAYLTECARRTAMAKGEPFILPTSEDVKTFRARIKAFKEGRL